MSPYFLIFILHDFIALVLGHFGDLYTHRSYAYLFDTTANFKVQNLFL